MLLLLLPATAGAQEAPIRFRVQPEAAEVRPGGTVLLTVTARIPRGWHLYGLRQPAGGPLATTLEVAPTPPFSLAAPVTSSAAHSEFDPNFGLLVEWHDDSASFRVPVSAAPTGLPGSYDARVRVSYQRCNDRVCLPLTTDTLRALLTIAGSPEPQATSSSPDARANRTTRPNPGTRDTPPATADAAQSPPTVPTMRAAADSAAALVQADTPAAPQRPAGGPGARRLVLAAAVAVLVALVFRRRRG